jgi:hypothetical protein
MRTCDLVEMSVQSVALLCLKSSLQLRLMDEYEWYRFGASQAVQVRCCVVLLMKHHAAMWTMSVVEFPNKLFGDAGNSTNG